MFPSKMIHQFVQYHFECFTMKRVITLHQTIWVKIIQYAQYFISLIFLAGDSRYGTALQGIFY